MKICFICEGGYPYIAGGVSSWIQMLLKAFPEHEFQIWSIATNRKEMSVYKYIVPENVKEIKTIYLEDKEFQIKNKKILLMKEEKETLQNLVSGSTEQIEWVEIVQLIQKYRKRLCDLLMGEDFFNIVLAMYNNQKSKTVFSEYLWNVRSMYFPLINILSGEFLDADIYHAVSTGYAGLLGSFVSYIKEKPLILSEHGIYTREREEDIIRAEWLKGDYKELWINFFKKLSAITYQRATVVTTLFETNQTLQKELNCNPEKIRIIPNGVTLADFKNLKKRSEESKEYFNIGTILRVVPIKDVKTMLVAFSIVKHAISNARLNILGNYDENPEYYQECLELIEELHIKDVMFYGQVNIKEYLNEFDLLLLTSISEGQPLAILEGMAAGIPFVATNVGDCKNLLEGAPGDTLGRAGFIVPIMNTEELAKKIIYCAYHKDLLESMGEVGKKRVEQYYQKKDFLKQYELLYQTIGGE